MDLLTCEGLAKRIVTIAGPFKGASFSNIAGTLPKLDGTTSTVTGCHRVLGAGHFLGDRRDETGSVLRG